MNERRVSGWLQPDNLPLLIGIAGLQVVSIAVPMLWGARFIWMVSGLLIGLAAVLFSVRRTLLLLLLVNIVLPVKVLDMLILPGGLRFPEGVLLVAVGFALVELVYGRGLQVSTSMVDGPVLAFLGVSLLSGAVGLAHGNLATVILRDLRFPLYYGVFFLATNALDRQAVLRRVLPVLLFAATIVSIEYILEFVGALDLSVGSRFVRVARLEGLALPIAMIFIVNQFIHHPGRYRRWWLSGLFVPISLAFVITVGRGMWVAFGAGLLVSLVLWHFSRPAAQRRLWQAIALLAALMGVIGATVFAFQRFTGSAVGVYALERSRTFVDFARDVHFLGRLSSYAIAWQQILSRPLLGSGQGATLVFFIFDPEFNTFGVHQSWTVDNLYLALWWKMGIGGLLAFGWIKWRLLRTAYCRFRDTADPQVRAFAGGAVAMIAGMGVMGMSDAAMVSGRFAMVFALLFGSIAVVTGQQEPQEKEACIG